MHLQGGEVAQWLEHACARLESSWIVRLFGKGVILPAIVACCMPCNIIQVHRALLAPDSLLAFVTKTAP